MHLLPTAILLILSVVQGPPWPPAVAVPEGDGAWTISVTTIGGFSGGGRGSATVTSQGVWNCPQTVSPCARKLSENQLAGLKSLIVSFDLQRWATGNPAPGTGLCSDCYTTLFTFARRENGNLEVFRLSWDDASRSSAPPEAVRIAEMMLAGNWQQ